MRTPNPRPFRVTGINGRIDDILVARTKFGRSTVASQVILNASTNQSENIPTATGANGTFTLASGQPAGSNTRWQKSAYSALRLRVQATSAGSPGSTTIGLTYNTGLGQFVDRFRVLARADVETVVYVIGGNIIGNEFYHAPIWIYADAAANGVFPGFPASSVAGTYTNAPSFNVSVDAITAQAGTLDEFLSLALNTRAAASVSNDKAGV